jgi:cyclin H
LAIYGIFLDMQTEAVASPEKIQQVYQSARRNVATSRLSDAELLFTPSQIAIACYHMHDPEIVHTWLSKKAARARENGHGDDKDVEDNHLDLETLRPVLAEIENLITEQGSKGVSKERVTEVDKRLKYCSNPEKDPNSALSVSLLVSSSLPLIFHGTHTLTSPWTGLGNARQKLHSRKRRKG